MSFPKLERKKILKIGAYIVGAIGLIASILGIVGYWETHLIVKPTPTSTLTITPTSTSSPTLTPTLTPSPTITPSPIPTLGVKLISRTSNLACGEEASISVQTSPGEMCVIEFKTPGGNISESNTLQPIVADENGTCAWRWHVSCNITSGLGEVTVRVGNIVQVFPIEISDK